MSETVKKIREWYLSHEYDPYSPKHNVTYTLLKCIEDLERQLTEAQTQTAYEQERNWNNVVQADEEIGRLKAALERAREALEQCLKELRQYHHAEEGRAEQLLQISYGMHLTESALAALDVGIDED